MTQHSRPAFAVPADGIDCHMHVFGTVSDYPPAARRSYTPHPAKLEDYLAMLGIIGLTRNVFVQASAYGADNACMLAAMRRRGALCRGIAVIDDHTTETELDEMHALGVRGVRLNVATFGLTDTDALRHQMQSAIARVAHRGWHIQIFAKLPMLIALQEDIKSAPCPVVIDHMGLPEGPLGLGQPGFSTICELLTLGHVWVKVSGTYRVIMTESDFSAATPFARALITANPERCVWGTDWPHIGHHGQRLAEGPPLAEFRTLDDGQLLTLLADAAGPHLAKILVQNPSTLYQF